MKIGKHHITLTWGDIYLFKNKSFEYQIEFGARQIMHPFELSLLWKNKQDHAGISFTFSIHTIFWLNINIHDHRHWDHNTDQWQK